MVEFGDSRLLRTEQFEVMHQLGSGSFGEVFLAKDLMTGENVAIKSIDMEAGEGEIEEVQKEIAILAECSNQHITRYYGSFLNGYNLWIVMEYLGGGSCSDLLKHTGPFSEAAIAFVCQNILLGLCYLHKNRKIHRDIKAANILVSQTGDVKIADFGVAAQLSSNVSLRNTFVGTPFWMAPEVIAERSHNYSADIWSLGVTAIEFAEGRPPWSHLNPSRAMFSIVKEQPPQLSDKFSQEFRHFVSLCLIKDPILRPTPDKLLQHLFFKKASRQELLARVHQLESLQLQKIPMKSKSISTDTSEPLQDKDDDGDWDFDTIKPVCHRLSDSTLASREESLASTPISSADVSTSTPAKEPTIRRHHQSREMQAAQPQPAKLSPNAPLQPVSVSESSQTDFATWKYESTGSDRRSHLVKVFESAAYKYNERVLVELAERLTAEPLLSQTENYIIKKLGRIAVDENRLQETPRQRKYDQVESVLLKRWAESAQSRH